MTDTIENAAAEVRGYRNASMAVRRQLRRDMCPLCWSVDTEEVDATTYRCLGCGEPYVIRAS